MLLWSFPWETLCSSISLMAEPGRVTTSNVLENGKVVKRSSNVTFPASIAARIPPEFIRANLMMQRMTIKNYIYLHEKLYNKYLTFLLLTIFPFQDSTTASATKFPSLDSLSRDTSSNTAASPTRTCLNCSSLCCQGSICFRISGSWG